MQEKIGFNYSITIEKILEIHNNILNIYGGLKGIKDKQQIESILQHIQNNKYYPSLIKKRELEIYLETLLNSFGYDKNYLNIF